MLVIGTGDLVTRDAENPFIENGAVAMDAEQSSMGKVEHWRRSGKGIS